MAEEPPNPLNLEKIKALREKKKLTQAAAAAAAGMATAQQWSDIERGRYPGVSLTTLAKMATALGVKAKDLLK